MLRGAVSWGHRDCRTDHYTVFARVSSFIGWINGKIGNLVISFSLSVYVVPSLIDRSVFVFEVKLYRADLFSLYLHVTLNECSTTIKLPPVLVLHITSLLYVYILN